MRSQNAVFKFILKEWLLILSVAGLTVTSFYLGRLPSFSVAELQILFILAALFIAIKGLEQSGLIARLSQLLEGGRLILLKLVVATFILSMIVTNDVALIVVVPLTLALKTERKDILVILEALAANAGSALTPIGNPQNLFIYWFYNIGAESFITSIAPFSLAFLVLLVLIALSIKMPNNDNAVVDVAKVKHSVFVYAVILFTVILVVLHLIPVQVEFIVLLCAVFFDRNSLRIDYLLLLTFAAFFALAANVQSIFAENLNEYSQHIFIFSALLSQVVSNVPAALLLAKFAPHWQALVWGANVGGFGSLVGSLANLIAYRFYITHENTNDQLPFTAKFLVIGYVAFFIGIMLYFVVEKMG